MTNSADQDQLASTLFAKAMHIRVQKDKSLKVFVQHLILTILGKNSTRQYSSENGL